MTEELGTVEGISRRDMLKRSAIVGGGAAMVWAAPSVTTFGARAFGENGTPLTGFSYVAAIVRCDDSGTVTDYRVKYNVDTKTWDAPGTVPEGENPVGNGDALPGCAHKRTQAFADAWNAATATLGNQPPLNIVISQSGDLLTLTLVPSVGSDCVFTFDDGLNGVVKEAENLCANAVSVSGDGLSITFNLANLEAPSSS